MSVTDCTFLEQISSHKWRTTAKLPFKTRYGEVDVEAGFETDLFSMVPNTKYPDFWKAAVLHDKLFDLIRKNVPDRLVKTKWQADIALYDEMLIQSAVVFSKLQDYVGTEIAVDEFRKLLRISKTYYIGVAGWLGRVYQFFAD